MYTKFLCAALILANSFFSIEGMSIPWNGPVDRSRLTSPSKPNNSTLSGPKAIHAQPKIQTKQTVHTTTKTTTHQLSYSDICALRHDDESSLEYFHRMQIEDAEKLALREKEKKEIRTRLVALAYDQTISETKKAEILALTKQENVGELRKGLQEYEHRKKRILETQDLILKEIAERYPEFQPQSILVWQEPKSSVWWGSSESLTPAPIVSLEDCNTKTLDQLSYTTKSLLNYYHRKPILVLPIPEKTVKQKAKNEQIFVQCVESGNANVDEHGKISLSNVHFHDCYQIESPETIKKLREIPDMNFMTAADGTIIAFIGSSGPLAAVAPVIVPIAAVTGAGYVFWKVFAESEFGKAWLLERAKKAEIKAAKKAKEAEKKALLERAKKSSGGGGPKKPDDDNKDVKDKVAGAVAGAKAISDKQKGLNKKQQQKLNNQNRNPAQNEPVGNKGKYEDAAYHHPNSKGVKSPAPKNGQKALNNSILVKAKGNNGYQRRVGVSDGEIVVLDENNSGNFHGHVRTWKEICNDNGSKDLKKILLDNGLVDKKGNILCH